MNGMMYRFSNYIKSKFFLDDTPIRTVQMRLDIIKGCLRFFSFNTFDSSWRIGPSFVCAMVILVVSLIVDIRRAALMIDNRANERIEDIVESLVFVATQGICMCRLYKLVRYKDSYRAIIKKLSVDFCTWQQDERSRSVMATTTKIGFSIFWMDMLILVMTTAFFLTRSIKHRSLPSPASGFIIPYVDNQDTPYFEILFILQMWIIEAQIVMAFCWNNLFCSLCVLTCGHLETLRLQFKTQQNDGTMDCSVAGQGFEHDSTLGVVNQDIYLTDGSKNPGWDIDDFITKYNQIYQSVKELEGLYGAILGLQPIYTGLVIIASTLLYDGSQKSNLFLQISFDHIVELFLYCYFGDMLTEKSTALSFHLYNSNWYGTSISHQKSLIQMMHRSQKPFVLEAGIFGPLTMEMYSKSMQMTYSMWTVFKGRAAKN